MPIFLFSVLFGLSMDYQVFLLSRIHERWSSTGDTPGAIVHGVASTARLITGAAAIIVVVFAGFATGQLVAFQEMGFGIAIALAIDATLVRLLLIPAAMRLLGERNWYLRLAGSNGCRSCRSKAPDRPRWCPRHSSGNTQATACSRRHRPKRRNAPRRLPGSLDDPAGRRRHRTGSGRRDARLGA